MKSNIVRRILPKLHGANTVELYFWPKLLDRILVAGNYATVSSGGKRKSPRWGVSMSHVALSADPDASPTEWKLLRRERLNAWFGQFVAEDAAAFAAIGGVMLAGVAMSGTSQMERKKRIVCLWPQEVQKRKFGRRLLGIWPVFPANNRPIAGSCL